MAQVALRIAFMGASGTGKTTLVTLLAEKHGLQKNPVGARTTAYDMGFVDADGKPQPYWVDSASGNFYEQIIHTMGDNPQVRGLAAAASRENFSRGDKTCRALFQKTLQRSKIAWELEHHDTGFITDRTTLDDCAYLSLHDVYAVDDAYLNAALSHAMTYDIVFFTPMDYFQSLAGDSARVAASAYHKVYETMLLGLCEKSRLPYYIPCAELQDRVKFCEGAIAEAVARKMSRTGSSLHP